MLTPILHRKRKAAEAAARAIKEAGGTIEQTQAHLRHAAAGPRIAVDFDLHAVARACSNSNALPPAARVVIALLPTPFFVYYLWTWMKGVGEMDELERRIELEALGFAFPAAVVFLMTLGLLDLAISLNPDDFSLRHIWADDADASTYVGLWRAQAALPVKNRLKVLRAERDWSQQDLADQLGVSRQTINAIETEKYDPSLAAGVEDGPVVRPVRREDFSRYGTSNTEALKHGSTEKCLGSVFPWFCVSVVDVVTSVESARSRR